jgi:peptidoglycan hydrolase FlgJ
MGDLSAAATLAPPRALPPTGAAGGDMARIDAVAQEFEAVFLSEMLKPMFAGIETKPPFGGGHGGEVFRGLLLTEYGKAIAARGGVGIADAVRAEIIRMQGGA